MRCVWGKMQAERVSMYDENTVSDAAGSVTVQPGEIVTLSSVPVPKTM